jgi:hypothetical protein
LAEREKLDERVKGLGGGEAPQVQGEVGPEMSGPDLGAQGLPHRTAQEAVGLEDALQMREVRRLTVESETRRLADLGLGPHTVPFRWWRGP